jgi:ABC-type transport system substrate-binding protein
LLLESHILLPLFHEIDYRVAHPRVRRLTLRSSAPYVNYAELGKIEPSAPAVLQREGGGVLLIPFNGELRSLDPSLGVALAQAEVLPNIFNTLTESRKIQVVPGLAVSYAAEEGGKRFRFRLRDNVRFHDGRRLTARDVRYSFERLLQNRNSENRWFLATVRGARELINEQVGDLEGFRILSQQEFMIDLEQPLAFFPALLASPVTAIVPEGCDAFQHSWREGCVGTGPFRVVRFDPGSRLEVEANPHYWRSGLPFSDGVQFIFGLSPEEIVSGFRSGRYSVAWNLLQSDLETMRHQPQFASHYREAPALNTYYLAFNIHNGPFTDQQLRHGVCQSLDVDAVVRRSAGRLALPTTRFIPPGLPGHESLPFSRPPAKQRTSSSPLELRVMLNSAYQGPYAALTADVFHILNEQDIKTRVVETRSEYFTNQALALAQSDLLFTRWFADYPDADNFVHLLHSEEGLVGRLCGTPQIDHLIELGRTETEPRLRHEIYREIEEIIYRDALLLPLFHEQTYCFAAPEVENLEFNIFSPFLSYETAWLRKQ